MSRSPRAQALLDQVAGPDTRLGDLRRLAKEVGTDHALGLELWSTGDGNARRLGLLAMDKKRFDQALVDQLDGDLRQLEDPEEQAQLMDWMLANQLTKTRGAKRLIDSWEHSPSPLQRRTFWYQQARLRWTGQTPPDNTEHLLAALEARMADEHPLVQWAMNFTAGQIGTYDAERRERCVALGEQTGLYRDEVVARGCTPQFLPEFIRIQAGKLG